MNNQIGRKLVWIVVATLGALSVFGFSAFAEEPAAIDSAAIEDTESDIEKIEKKLKEEQAKKEKYEQSLNQTQGAINTTQSVIKKTEKMIKETEETIARKEKEVNLMDNKIEVQKEVLIRLMQEIYYSQQNPLENTVVAQESFAQMLGGADHLLTLEGKVNSIVENIRGSKKEIEKDKQELEENKQDHEGLLDMKEAQQQTLLSQKSETQVKVAQKEATISELNSELSKLKSSLSKLLGKAYNFDDIVAAAGFAAKNTGVRKDYLLGMLVVESNLGRYTGGCSGKDSKMSGSRLATFKSICEELGYDWKKKLVSCPPRNYKGTGGAMGVAQFMPDTWMGYKSSIASATGHNPPDPWSLTDGVVAMALKLARGGATSKSGECNASKLYLSGTTSSKYNWYCERVQYWADNYESKF